MFSRYNKESFYNNHENYKSMLKEKKLQGILMSEPKKLVPFSQEILQNLFVQTHVWTSVDKLYNVSAKYYQNPKYGWLILWANRKSLEHDIEVGETIYIPLPLEKTISLIVEN